MTDTPTSTAPACLLLIDWLRPAAFGLLVPRHVGMRYVGWHCHVKHPVLHPGLALFMRLLKPWRPGLLFVVALRPLQLQALGLSPAPPAARAAGRQPGTCASTSRASSASDCCQPT